jgi:hypothetical protein
MYFVAPQPVDDVLIPEPQRPYCLAGGDVNMYAIHESFIGLSMRSTDRPRMGRFVRSLLMR